LDTTLFQIKVSSSNTLDVGVYNTTLTGTLVNYSSFPALIVSFTVTITDCVTPNIAMSPTTYNYVINDPAV